MPISANPEALVDALSPRALFLVSAVLGTEGLHEDYAQHLLDHLPRDHPGDADATTIDEVVRSGLVELVGGKHAGEGDSGPDEGEDPTGDRVAVLRPGELALGIRNRIEQRLLDDRQASRTALVDHLVSWLDLGEDDKPLEDALRAVDRAAFLPQHLLPMADVDRPVPIKHETRMTESAPHAVCMTLAPLRPARRERVLICGTKGGYMAALAAHMVGDHGHVFCLDWDVDIVDHATRCVAAQDQLRHRIQTS